MIFNILVIIFEYFIGLPRVISQFISSSHLQPKLTSIEFKLQSFFDLTPLLLYNLCRSGSADPIALHQYRLWSVDAANSLTQVNRIYTPSPRQYSLPNTILPALRNTSSPTQHSLPYACKYCSQIHSIRLTKSTALPLSRYRTTKKRLILSYFL